MSSDYYFADPVRPSLVFADEAALIAGLLDPPDEMLVFVVEDDSYYVFTGGAWSPTLVETPPDAALDVYLDPDDRDPTAADIDELYVPEVDDLDLEDEVSPELVTYDDDVDVQLDRLTEITVEVNVDGAADAALPDDPSDIPINENASLIGIDDADLVAADLLDEDVTQ